MFTFYSIHEIENELMVAVGGDSQGPWDGQLHTARLKLDNQQGPTYCIAHGTLLNVIWHTVGGDLGENTCICMA